MRWRFISRDILFHQLKLGGCFSGTTDSTGGYVETTDALGGVTKFWFDANGQAAVLQDVKVAVLSASLKYDRGCKGLSLN